MNRVLVLQGPNLNMLGVREKSIYGATGLDELHKNLSQEAESLNLELEFFQSNREYEIIEKIHSTFNRDIEFIIINPAAFTHTSIAIRDALLSVNLPFIEIHISNIYQRESFRQKSFFSDKALGIIAGFGTFGYTMAINAAKDFLQNK